jgi:hypothetical protein
LEPQHLLITNTKEEKNKEEKTKKEKSQTEQIVDFLF